MRELRAFIIMTKYDVACHGTALILHNSHVRSSRGVHAHFCIALGQGKSPVMQGAKVSFCSVYSFI